MVFLVLVFLQPTLVAPAGQMMKMQLFVHFHGGLPFWKLEAQPITQNTINARKSQVTTQQALFPCLLGAASSRKSNRFVSLACLCVSQPVFARWPPPHQLPWGGTEPSPLSVLPARAAAGQPPDTPGRITSPESDTQTWQPRTAQQTRGQDVSLSTHVFTAWKSPQPAGESQTSSTQPSCFGGPEKLLCPAGEPQAFVRSLGSAVT